MLSSIYISSNGEETPYYCPYTINGEETYIVNGDEEFRESWNIPDGFEEVAINYINELYSGEGYIVSTTVLPAWREETTENRIMYLIQDDTRKFKGEFIFYYEQYREDLKNGQLKEMSEYMEVGTEYVYY